MIETVPHADWMGALILLGFFLHTLACILVNVAFKYCPHWFRVGWAALCIATILVFIRRALWAYSVVMEGCSGDFHGWEYIIYCLISLGWGVCGLQMILHGMKDNVRTTTSTRTTQETSTVDEKKTSERKDDHAPLEASAEENLAPVLEDA